MRKVVGLVVVAVWIGMVGSVVAAQVTTDGTAPTVEGVNNATSFFDNVAVEKILPLTILGILIGGATGLAVNSQINRGGGTGSTLVSTGSGAIIGAAAPLMTTGLLTGFSAAPLVSGPMLPVEGELLLRNPAVFGTLIVVPFARAAWYRWREARALAREEAAHDVV